MKLLALLFLLAAPAELVCQSGCGIVPVKPIPPVGCRALRPEYRCDSRGTNCRWEWVCVR